MAELDFAPALLQYLVTEGVAVRPADADGIVPVVFHDPKDGAPAPAGDLAGGTITLTTVGTPSAGEDNARKRAVVALNIRATTNAKALLIIRAVEAKLVPRELWGGKNEFQLGPINPCHLCLPFRGPQRVAVTDEGYQWDMAFEFMASRSVLST